MRRDVVHEDVDDETPEVLFVVDEDPADGVEYAVIADVSRDDAWLAAPAEDARTLTQWR